MNIFCTDNQQIGDIILISNKAISSKIQQIGQTVFSCKKSNYSHAILSLGFGMFIEAMKNNNKQKVDIFCIRELEERFKNEYENNWKVVRYKNLRVKITLAYFYAAKVILTLYLRCRLF